MTQIEPWLAGSFIPVESTEKLVGCLACGNVFLRGLEATHQADHDWMHDTNPIARMRPVQLRLPVKTKPMATW